jgi:hypothetical protein
MANELIQILEERLPYKFQSEDQRREINRMSDDISSLRETFNEYVKDSYSSSNEPGPIEVSVDTESFKEALDMVADSYAENQRLMAQQMEEAAEGFSDSITDLSNAIGENNELLGSIYDEQREITRETREGNMIQGANFAINVLGLGVAVQTLEEITEIGEELYGMREDLGEINRTLEWIDSGIGEVNINLRGVLQRQELQIKTQIKTIKWLEKTIEGIEGLEETVVSCFGALGKQQEIIISQVWRLNETLKALVEGQDKMRREIVGALNSGQVIKANERYSFAYDQYQIGSYSAAIKELKFALKEMSTHIPSLILLGTISTHYALWSKAKDSYYQASLLAKRNGDVKLYNLAMIGLANVEFLVGNRVQAKRLIEQSIEKDYSPELDKAYLKMCARGLR